MKCVKNHFAKFEIFIQKQGRIQELVQGAKIISRGLSIRWGLKISWKP